MRALALALAVSLLTIAPGCGEEGAPAPGTGTPAPAADGKADGTGTAARYSDMQSYLENGGGDIDAWFGLKSKLKGEFDDVCGDTFCGGDYPPWSINLDCSVRISTGTISRCSWLFAGAYAAVNPDTGTLAQKKKFWTCNLPWSGLTPAYVMERLSAAGTDTGLRREMQAGKSTYDALADCGLGH